MPTPTRPPSESDAPWQSELGKTEVETEAWTAEMAAAERRVRRIIVGVGSDCTGAGGGID